MQHAAKIVNRNPLLDNLQAKKTGQELPPEDQSVDFYAEEEKSLRYNISDYYMFNKHKYQLPLVYRTLVWEVLAIISGIVCFYIPFGVYGYGVADSSGRTEDLFSTYFASYQANILTHHLQMFVLIKNYTRFFAITCTASLSMLWPITIVLCNYQILPSEVLHHRMGEIFYDQFFLQLSSVVLSTAVIILPIYCFKIIKMRLVYPQFYPTA